jgi:hypothetical protein
LGVILATSGTWWRVRGPPGNWTTLLDRPVARITLRPVRRRSWTEASIIAALPSLVAQGIGISVRPPAQIDPLYSNNKIYQFD